MARESSVELIRSHLEDAIAAEKNFELQLRQFAGEADDPAVRRLFAQHAEETRLQHERLKVRLEELGGSPSGVKSFLAHVFGASPKAAQIGRGEPERATQNLIIAFAVENAEVAMYEALATACSMAGDFETEEIARSIQIQERQTADKVWSHIGRTARDAFLKIAAAPSGGQIRRAG